jgi:hypothetical protein
MSRGSLIKGRRHKVTSGAVPTAERPPIEPGDEQLHRLFRRHRNLTADDRVLDATRTALRLERLASRLALNGPVAVRATVLRRGGDRLDLHLDDGTILKLRLFWRRRESVVAIESMRWDDRIGWVLVVHTAAGARRVDYAWLATFADGAA